MRPFLDALAAAWDSCPPCTTHHCRAVAADPALTVHVVGVALCGLGHDLATARQLLCKLDPDGAAIALTIRNSGLLPAVEIATEMGPDRRESAARIAMNAIVSAGWYDVPVSNFVPPVNRPSTDHLRDDEMLATLRSDGYLPYGH
ncbi:hypothetical protein GA0074694_2742 [Micromonospora inyonensis]|uniref:Uncharacterized protein n=2 Tax=Micromonospora inyonensis TaxID=47866 RepID=A0A1C6RQT4_9ACTN|nr:hypothetical protein GA0074694_2742 [Micromonospora inyonensis]